MKSIFYRIERRTQQHTTTNTRDNLISLNVYLIRHRSIVILFFFPFLKLFKYRLNYCKAAKIKFYRFNSIAAPKFIFMITTTDRQLIAQALNKAIAYKNCQKEQDAIIWAKKLIELLQLTEILKS